MPPSAPRFASRPTPAVRAARPAARPAWADTPVRIKLTLLVMTAAVGGALVGVMESQLGHHTWPLLLGLSVVVTAVAPLVVYGVVEPIEQLADKARRAWRTHRALSATDLQISRGDEIGRLAQLLQELSSDAYRHSADAHQLRRTLDHRVEAATRRAAHELWRMMMRDPLTGLANRRFLDEHLKPLVRCCRDSNTDLPCVLIDLDGLRAVNDKLGEATGDQLLRLMGRLIRAGTRRCDYAVRLGGDEFVILLPGASPYRVGRLCRHLAALFHQHRRVAVRGRPACGVSIGVAWLLRDKLEGGRDLLARADVRLRSAKQSGGDRIVGVGHAASEERLT